MFARGRLGDEHGRPIAEGSDAVAAFYAGSVILHDGTPRTKHLVTNTVVELSDDATSAIARSSYLVLQQVGDGPLEPIVTGRYEDHLSAADGWHFVERRFFVDLVGDLSRHLRFDIA